MKIAYLVIGAIVVAALAGAGGFYGGMTYAQSQAQNTVANFARQRAIQGGQGGTGGSTGGQGAQANANDPCGFGGFGRGGANGGGQGGAGGGAGGQGGAPNGAQGNAQGNGQGGGQGNFQRGQGGGGNFGGGFGGAGGLNLAQMGSCVARGQVTAVNGDTVTVTTADKVVTIKVDDNTVISETSRGSINDFQNGDRVTVFSRDAGDTPTASVIMLTRPITPTNQ